MWPWHCRAGREALYLAEIEPPGVTTLATVTEQGERVARLLLLEGEGTAPAAVEATSKIL
jgi:hypothetical protein